MDSLLEEMWSANRDFLRRRYVRFESALSEGDIPAPSLAGHNLDLMEIRTSMAGLPKVQRDALVMKHYGGYSYEDIAAHMNCAVGTAKRRQSSRSWVKNRTGQSCVWRIHWHLGREPNS